MARPVLVPQIRRVNSPVPRPRLGGSVPYGFASAVLALLCTYQKWPWDWLASGAPILTYTLLVGATKGTRILPFISIWTLVSTINLAYAVASTSWLLNGVFIALCYPSIVVAALFQSSLIASFVRRRLRRIISHVQFVEDQIALFGLPALEIDTEVQGLLVVRGVSLSLSSLTLVAHGVEVGIKLSDDMELAIQVETVTVALFRSINISDVYANVKGGEYEMTFGNMGSRAVDKEDLAFMGSDSAMLKRAATTGSLARPPLVTMTTRLNHSAEMEDANPRDGLRPASKVSGAGEVEEKNPKEAFKSVTTVSGATEPKNYGDNFKWIKRTNMIQQCYEAAMQLQKEHELLESPSKENDIRAAISAMLHVEPSIPHPPAASVKVTRLRKMSSPTTKRLMHRMPMLLRLLLSPVSYFHPITIKAVVAAGSGKWITGQLNRHVFRNYVHENAELRRLEKRILSWLSDASFAVIMEDFEAMAQVPFLTHFDIASYMAVTDLLAYRTADLETLQLAQVVRMGGADATFSIPTFLLPHHEHLVPAILSASEKKALAWEAEHMEGMPKRAQKKKELKRAEKDETNVKMAVHARLPAVFDQELLNFVAALVKATKVVELEREAEAYEPDGKAFSDGKGFRDLAHNLNKGMKDGMKKVMAEGVVNDRWIAKMVGKITRQLGTAQGEVGYSGDIPVALAPYRLPDGHVEKRKILA